MYSMEKDVRVLLHNIRSTHNVGAILRTADALGVSHFYFSGYTPTPLDRFGRPVKEIAKTALGAELTIPWTYAKTPEKFLRELRREGFVVLGIEQDTRAVDYKQYQAGAKTLVVVGNEVRGLSKNLRGKCDVLIDIPMRGKKESLNVSVAFGVALFRVLDQ
jgi:tRNA G18 (ribose-2'-O)-methylase SpoU